ncbi:ABC transporter permease [Spongiimicrobium sp. 3-5]|uniref:ABC transporter permease n=1 Tax=Spongiimicrobium sp. 3-5 TaxID=3332596 RepID=UPI00397FAC2C
MIRHNLLLFFRNLKKHKSSFLINVIGLSTGLACVLLVYLWASDELKVDKFHKNDSLLYQVLTNHHTDEGIATWREAPVLLAPAFEKEMPEVAYAVNASWVEDVFTLSHQNKHFNASGRFAGKNYFKIFSYELLQGSEEQVLRDKNAIVISESMALKLFDTTVNIIGNTLQWEYEGHKMQYTISGIFKDLPAYSTDQFDFVVPFAVYEDLLGDSVHWGNHQAKVYLMLRPGTHLKDFNRKIEGFIRTKWEHSITTLMVQRYSDKYLHGRYENGKIVGGRIDYVWLFSLIAVFILIIACINFINLSTARASRRLKEVGIKKTMGASRKALIFQYFGESLVLALLSLLVAIGLVILLLPQFNEIAGKEIVLVYNLNHLLLLAAITLLTALVAGSYPALYLSGFDPALILKGKINRSLSELWLRKGLVVFQFTLSIILIVSVLVVYQQIVLTQTKNLGYDRDNIIYFTIKGKVTDHLETFLAEARKIPGVSHASGMWGSVVDDTGISQGTFNWEGKDPNVSIPFSNLGISYDLIELLGIEMEEGRTFSKDFGNDTSNIIYNAAAIDAMGLEDPIGKKVTIWGTEMTIIGVTKNFHFRSLYEEVKPLFFRLLPNDADKVLIKLKPETTAETLEKLNDFYQTYNPGFSFDFKFLDADYQALYHAEQKVSSLSKYFAGLAIIISCLGLFGLAAFTGERRRKEIGIRKVLGQTSTQVTLMLSNEFAKLVLISILIALPLAYLVTSNWLSGFAFRIPLRIWYFIGAGFTAMVVAMFTVGSQTIRAANRNPVNALREE